MSTNRQGSGHKGNEGQKVEGHSSKRGDSRGNGEFTNQGADLEENNEREAMNDVSKMAQKHGQGGRRGKENPTFFRGRRN